MCKTAFITGITGQDGSVFSGITPGQRLSGLWFDQEIEYS